VKAIVCSERDVAGMNIRSHLLQKGFESTDKQWEGETIYQRDQWMLVTTKDELVYAQQLADLDCDEIIFASRHSSAAGKPTLTAHVPGNFGPADLGGEPGQLCYASAQRMLAVYRELMKNPYPVFGVSLEVTHHGPFIPQKCCFIELGSGEEQWKNEKAGEFLAECIIRGIESDEDAQPVIGIGGPHYCPELSRYEGEYAFGHILPRYAWNHLNKKMVQQMIERTVPKAEKIIVDHKGIKGKTELAKLLDGYDVEWV